MSPSRGVIAALAMATLIHLIHSLRWQLVTSSTTHDRTVLYSLFTHQPHA